MPDKSLQYIAFLEYFRRSIIKTTFANFRRILNSRNGAYLAVYKYSMYNRTVHNSERGASNRPLALYEANQAGIIYETLEFNLTENKQLEFYEVNVSKSI